MLGPGTARYGSHRGSGWLPRDQAATVPAVQSLRCEVASDSVRHSCCALVLGKVLVALRVEMVQFFGSSLG